MFALGTIVNTASIIICGVAGLFIKKGIREDVQNSVMRALGVATAFVGISGAMSGMLEINSKGKIGTTGSMMMIISIAIGTVLGEFLNIEGKLNSIGDFLKSKFNLKGDNQFTEAFVTTTLIVCVGAMAIVGSIQDGINSDPSILFAKSILDGILAFIYSTTMGVGVVFSAIPVFLYQGGITLVSGLISGFISDALISNLSYIGSILIFIIGANIAFNQKIKVGNMLPSLLVPIAWELINVFLLK